MNNEILDENIVYKPQIKLADKGARYVNFLLDAVVFLVLFIVYNSVFSELRLFYNWSTTLIIHSSVLYLFYYTILEFLFNKTLGKFLTQTKVIRVDGKNHKFLNILGRNMARFIPIDFISFFFSKQGIHDRISTTIVICDD